MPRTAAEATRFTATRPHAHSKSSVSSTIDLAGPPPANETPAQKVARLREASRRAKLSQESTWERVISRGKVVADTAHKTVTGGLILASIIAAGFATYSFGSMMLHNRRKKRVWLEEQMENYDKALALAKQAEADGTITPSLAMFLNKERAVEEAEAEKRNKPSFWRRVKNTAFGGLAYEEPKAKVGASASAAEAQDQAQAKAADRMAIAREQESMTREMVPELVVGELEPGAFKAAHDSREVEGRGAGQGGPLDRLGEQTASSLTQTWSRWFVRR